VQPSAPPAAAPPPPEQSSVEPPVLVTDEAPAAVLAPPPAPAAEPAGQPFIAAPAAAAALLSQPTSGATRVVGNVVPLYRIEVPTYSVIAPAARETVLSTLGTFHDRRGDQTIVNPHGDVSAAWLRAFGQSIEQTWAGTVSPSIDGQLHGIQGGLDLLDWEGSGGQRDVAGLWSCPIKTGQDQTSVCRFKNSRGDRYPKALCG
jgi:outer membrane autotransporter protein